MSHSHRPTQKQTNKAFKSKHSTKGARRDEAKGRTHRPAVKTALTRGSSNASTSFTRLNRRNQATQRKLKKRGELEELGQLFSRKGEEKVARVVAVVPMTGDVVASQVVEQLLAAVGVVGTGEHGMRKAEITRFHAQTLSFVLLPPASSAASLFPILDACAAADFVVIAMSSEQEVDAKGETALRCMGGMGVGGVGGVVGVVTTLPLAAPSATATRVSLHSFLTHFFPTVSTLSCLASTSESSSVVRGLCEKVPRGIRWREGRGRVLGEHCEWVMNEAQDGGSEALGTLRVEGVVRGSRMNADRLVHLQGYGDFMLDKITSTPSARLNKVSTAMETELVDLSVPSANADDLTSTNIPDDQGEQTWPTEEEMASAPGASTSSAEYLETEREMLPPALPGTTPKRVLKKVPRGTSAYQAAWIIDEDDEDVSGDEEESQDEDDYMTTGMEEKEHDAATNVFDDETASVSVRPFADLSPEAEAAQLASYLQARALERHHQSLDDASFPDEVDTPLHIPARERFARYRGMKSFRTSPWDAYEGLPEEYGKCFEVKDWKGMGRKMEDRAGKEGVEVGTRVILHIKNVPAAFAKTYTPALPLVVFSLHAHEHKYSVTHFTIQRNTEYTLPVRSKDPLVLLLGPRRFVINPIFSQHTTRGGGKGANNVHKFERFLKAGIQASIGTAYLPITFGAQPAVVLRVPSTSTAAGDTPSTESSIHLVGTGTLLSSDPTRITAKRLVLTGAPFKVHKKTATIRYMFFNSTDIDFYKPIQLRTKRGRVGHIRESLGTHGYFKAGFDGPIDQMDAILLSLYKRQFPRWAEVWDGGLVGAPKIRDVEEVAEEEDYAMME